MLQIPQLWSSGLRTSTGKDVLTRRVASVAERELEKEREENQKAEDRKALAQAKLESKEAYAALKAQIEQGRAAAVEARRLEKLRLAAERQAEKAKAAADSKARRGGRKVCALSLFSLSPFVPLLTIGGFEAVKRKAISQTVDGFPDGEQRVLPAPQHQDEAMPDEQADGDDIQNDKFLLHPEDPTNFLKLCAALRVLIRRRITDSDIDTADRLLREYCTELIPV
jgi:hypothetical protein